MTKEIQEDDKGVSNKALYRKIKANKYQSFDFNMVYGKNKHGKIIKGYYKDSDEVDDNYLTEKNNEFIKHHITKLQKTLNKLKIKILNQHTPNHKKKFNVLKFLDKTWVEETLSKHKMWKTKYEALTQKIDILNSKVFENKEIKTL
eukprot:GAHX01001118.1.p1 GENE.GAHX01001118.1~~GAHX01001118.1.p1  ORF type:complete len:159 (-),score=52.54 GAHX01001118.1:41-478(-)